MSKIIKKEIDFAKWYTSVILEADLIEYGLAKGSIIFKPYAWSIWNNIKKIFTRILDELNTQECSFPMLIPYSEFQKEKKHIEGFNPELFKISSLSEKKLDDELVLRPTSEILFCHYFKKNVKSYQDLPCILNQWCNVFRVEKNTRPFLRNTEFFWQEQHAVFKSKQEAFKFSKIMINVYKYFINKYLNIDVLVGEKTINERFAGAENTFTVEAMMPDMQALQSATSHYLGDNFSKNFEMKFQNDQNKFEYMHQTSAGISTRIIGAIIMSHSDNNGLVLPFYIAPIQFAIILNNEEIKSSDIFLKVKEILKKYRTKIFITKKSMGLILKDNEIKGIPFQIIIGSKEIEKNLITIYKRDTKNKDSINIDQFNLELIKNYIQGYSNNLYNNTKERIKNNLVFVKDFESFKEEINNKKFVVAYWNGSIEDEKKIKEITGATARCYINDFIKENNPKCFFTKKTNAKLLCFARAY